MADQVDEIVKACKLIIPNRFCLNLKTQKTHLLQFESLLSFLIETRYNRPKLVFEMAYDYFQLLQDYYENILHLRSFKFNQINSNLAKKLYLDFIRKRGETYWAYGEGKVKEPVKWLHSKGEHSPKFIPEKKTPLLNPTLTPDELLSRIKKTPNLDEITERKRVRDLQWERIDAIKDRVCQKT